VILERIQTARPEPPSRDDTDSDRAMVDPGYGVKGEDLPSLAILVSNRADLQKLCETVTSGGHRREDLFLSTLHVRDLPAGRIALAGPMIGAPYAVMVLEKLIARGARRVLFFGWCGAVSARVGIGDIVVPSGSIIDEGTSVHYSPDGTGVARASEPLSERLKRALGHRNLPFHEGLVWSTDAVYRETRRRVSDFKRRHVLGVEMETSALFSVGRFRGIEVAAILAVSDELSGPAWRPGFSSDRFRSTRKAACEVIRDICNGA